MPITMDTCNELDLAQASPPRPYIIFAITYLACFTKNPNSPAFLSLEKLMHYLHTHLHEPIFYLQQQFGPTQNIYYDFSPNNHPHSLSSSYICFSDSVFGYI